MDWIKSEARSSKNRPSVSRSDTSIVFLGTVMGGAILGVSIFTILPLPSAMHASIYAHYGAAALGGIVGVLVGRRTFWE